VKEPSWDLKDSQWNEIFSCISLKTHIIFLLFDIVAAPLFPVCQ